MYGLGKIFAVSIKGTNEKRETAIINYYLFKFSSVTAVFATTHCGRTFSEAGYEGPSNPLLGNASRLSVVLPNPTFLSDCWLRNNL